MIGIPQARNCDVGRLILDGVRLGMNPPGFKALRLLKEVLKLDESLGGIDIDKDQVRVVTSSCKDILIFIGD
jgi:hypothetical protein